MKTGVVVIGVSTGGFHALHVVLAPLPRDFPVPIAVVQHQYPKADDYLVRSLNEKCQMAVKYPENGEMPRPGMVYVAPPDRHLRFTECPCFMLSDDVPVNYSRPSINFLFLSAAAVYGDAAIGVVLTGANQDGAEGLREIKARGGLAIVQDPETAVAAIMPNAAIAATEIDYIIPLDQIGPVLWDVAGENRKGVVRKEV